MGNALAAHVQHGANVQVVGGQKQGVQRRQVVVDLGELGVKALKLLRLPLLALLFRHHRVVLFVCLFDWLINFLFSNLVMHAKVQHLLEDLARQVRQRNLLVKIGQSFFFLKIRRMKKKQ